MVASSSLVFSIGGREMKLKEAVKIMEDIEMHTKKEEEAWNRILEEIQVCNYHLEERE